MFLFILKVANIRCFILRKCSEQGTRFKKYVMRPKLKNCLYPAPDRPLEKSCDLKYFLGDLRRLFFYFFYWLPEIVTGCSDIVPEFTFGTGLHF